MEDNIAAVREHLCGDGLTLCGIGEGFGILGLNLNVQALLFVCKENTGPVAILKLIDDVRCLAANKADLTRLSGASCNVTNEERRLLSAEGNTRKVGN